MAFQLPAKMQNMPHREPVLNITDTSDGTFVACSQDGLVTFWTGQMDLKRDKSVIVSIYYTCSHCGENPGVVMQVHQYGLW